MTLEDVAGEAKKRLTLPDRPRRGRGHPEGGRRRPGDPPARPRAGPAPGVEPGDALLTIKIAPHERFTPEGSNLRLRLPLEIEEAMLGGTVRVPTLNGVGRDDDPAA